MKMKNANTPQNYKAGKGYEINNLMASTYFRIFHEFEIKDNK